MGQKEIIVVEESDSTLIGIRKDFDALQGAKFQTGGSVPIDGGFAALHDSQEFDWNKQSFGAQVETQSDQK